MARSMGADAWQAYTQRQAAIAAGKWLESKGAGRLAKPIRTLTLADLEGITQAAIARWIVLSSFRLIEKGEGSEDLDWLLQG